MTCRILSARAASHGTAATGGLRHRLKNKNAGLQDQDVWRYHRYDSYIPQLQKSGVLMGVLKKVEWMASDEEQLRGAATDKLMEFAGLGYPLKVLRRACYKMYGASANPEWVDVARTLHD